MLKKIKAKKLKRVRFFGNIQNICMSKHSTSFVKKCKKYLKDFLDNTSIHGLSYINSRGHERFRFLWVIVVALGLAGSYWLGGLSWSRYAAQPKLMSIKDTHLSISNVPFIGVSVCDQTIANPRIDIFLEEIKYTEDITPSEVRVGIHKMRKSFSVRGNLAKLDEDLEKLNTILIFNNLSVRNVLNRLSTPCNETILHCRWEGVDVPCNKIFKYIQTGYGFCCALELFPNRKSWHVGPETGLSLIIQQSIQETVAPDGSGTVIFLHRFRLLASSGILPHECNGTGIVPEDAERPMELPWKAGVDPGYTMSPLAGTNTFASINVDKVVYSNELMSLAVESRECVQTTELPLRYFPSYIRGSCMVECLVNASKEVCGCAPYNTPVDDDEVCRIEDLLCLYDHYDILFSARLIKEDPDGDDDGSLTDDHEEEETVKPCPCWNTCFFFQYTVHDQQMALDAVEFDRSGFYDFIANRTTAAVVHIYFGSQVAKVIEMRLIADWISLLGSLGGVASLCLGCSFITLIEIVYFCCIRISFCKTSSSDVGSKSNKIADENFYYEKPLKVKNVKVIRGTFVGPALFGKPKEDGLLPKRRLSFIQNEFFI